MIIVTSHDHYCLKGYDQRSSLSMSPLQPLIDRFNKIMNFFAAFFSVTLIEHTHLLSSPIKYLFR